MSNQTEEQKLAPEFKSRWLQALRGGHYKQCRKLLRGQRGGFCCLGVALDLIDHKAWAKKPHYVDNEVSQYGYDWKKIPVGEVGREVAQALGISRDKCLVLAEFNDEGRRGFKWIADWIEKNL